MRLHLAPTRKFKTATVKVFLRCDLEPKVATEVAALPFVLRRGTESVPSLRGLSRRLEELYGASLEPHLDKVGEQQVLSFSLRILGDSADFFGVPDSTSGGDDDISGGPGNDQIRGGPGDDDIDGNAGDDAMFGNQGDDDMNGHGGDDFMGGGIGNDDMDGHGGDDFVSGGFGDDELRGGGGSDFITGDLPNGQEDPFPNHDDCDGGGGADELVFCEDGDD